MNSSYKDLLIELGFDKSQLEMFIKEQQEMKQSFDKIGKFNSKTMGSTVQPVAFTYKGLYQHIKSHYNVSPSKPMSKQQSTSVLQGIKNEQESSVKTIEEGGISEELHELIYQAIDLHNSFCELQLDHQQAEFVIMTKFDGAYEGAVQLLNEIISTMLVYQDMDTVEEERLIYFRGLWSAIEELRMLVS